MLLKLLCLFVKLIDDQLSQICYLLHTRANNYDRIYRYSDKKRYWLMAGILIIGAGGHAKVVADALLCQGTSVIGYVDDDPTLVGEDVLGLPVLGLIDGYINFKPDGLVMGIGSNTIRRTIVERLGEVATFLWRTVIHPTAIVSKSVQLNPGTVILAGVIVNPDSVIGSHAIINTSATIDHDCDIGDYAHIAPGVHLAGSVSVGSGTLMGISSSVIPYRSVGKWATIGAGAVVINNVPDGVIAKGVPARWETITKESL
jgi:sugar O-acyltransferase (sialic acid O-acetyltransferase NeuD family)